MSFERVYKYYVIKEEDASLYLSEIEQNTLDMIYSWINEGRVLDGKPLNKYVVVNEREPYSEQVWKLIEDNVNES